MRVSNYPTRRCTSSDVAGALRMNEKTVRRYARQGCPHDRDDRGRLRFDLSEVREWMDRTGLDGRPGRPDGGGVERWTDGDMATLKRECPDLLTPEELERVSDFIGRPVRTSADVAEEVRALRAKAAEYQAALDAEGL